MKNTANTLLNDADFAPQVTLERAVKPPAKWKNRWRAPPYAVSLQCSKCGFVIEVGPREEYGSHCKLYPSRDMAETDAEELARETPAFAAQYLGAFPVEGDT